MKLLTRLCLLPALLSLRVCTGLDISPINLKVCKDDVCIGITIPGQKIGGGEAEVKPGGKEVVPVQ